MLVIGLKDPQASRTTLVTSRPSMPHAVAGFTLRTEREIWLAVLWLMNDTENAITVSRKCTLASLIVDAVNTLSNVATLDNAGSLVPTDIDDKRR